MAIVPISKKSVQEDFETSEGLRSLAQSRGLTPPEPKKPFSALQKVAKILNAGTALTSGVVRGALSKEETIPEAVKNQYTQTKGFSEVFRNNLGVKPQSRTGKVALATVGFAADVLFDPLTYLTFGMGAGLKVGGKTLSKTGTALAQKASSEIAEAGGKVLPGAINELILRSTGKKGITDEAVEQFVKLGVKRETLEAMRRASARELVDQGGVKFAGQSILSSQAIKATGIGKVGEAIGKIPAVAAAKEALGKTFIADFGKNPKLVELIDQGSRAQRQAAEKIIQANKELFKDLSDDEMTELFETVFKKKLEIIPKTGNAAKVYHGTTTGNKFSTFDLTKADSGVGSNVLNQGNVAYFSKDPKTAKVFSKLANENKALKTADISNLGKVSDEPFGEVLESSISADAKIKKLDYAPNIDEISKLKKEGFDGVEFPDKKAFENTLQGRPNLLKELGDDSTVALWNTDKIINDRQALKAMQQREKLTFQNPRLQEVSDKLFEGDNAIVKRFAKAAGLSEEDAIKFYIPSKFQDKLKVKNISLGRNISSPDLGFLKEFGGVRNEQLITDPFEAYSRGQIEVATARVKEQTSRAVIKNMGLPINTFPSEDIARRAGFEKWSRKGPEGKIEGYLPKEIVEELNKFISPQLKPIDELAKAVGFDWATGMFKGYVTSLFPAFHIRNITSNTFQNMLKMGVNGLNPVLQKNALAMSLGRNLDTVITTKTGQKYTLGQLRQLIQKNSDILDQGAFGTVEQFIEEGAGQITRRATAKQLATKTLNPLSRENIALRAGRAVGTTAEEQAKLVSVLGAVMEGKTIKEAVKQAEDTLFNYKKLTDFERSVLRRIIPFYTWGRKNIELQIKTLATNPGRVASQMKVIRSAGEAFGKPVEEDDLAGLPDYVLEGLGIKAGANQYGQELFFTGFGLPIEAFLGQMSGDKGVVWNTVQNYLGQLNPIIKTPLERATGNDFFQGRPLTELDNAEPLLLFVEALGKDTKLAKEFKDLIGFIEVPNQPVYKDGKVVGRTTKYRANPYALHWFRSLPTARLGGTSAFLLDQEEPWWSKTLRFFTGVRGWTIDQERQKFFNELEEKQELEKFLLRAGVVKQFSRTYIPKEKKLPFIEADTEEAPE